MQWISLLPKYMKLIYMCVFFCTFANVNVGHLKVYSFSSKEERAVHCVKVMACNVFSLGCTLTCCSMLWGFSVLHIYSLCLFTCCWDHMLCPYSDKFWTNLFVCTEESYNITAKCITDRIVIRYSSATFWSLETMGQSYFSECFHTVDSSRQCLAS
jgi:hypothetical protein